MSDTDYDSWATASCRLVRRLLSRYSHEGGGTVKAFMNDDLIIDGVEFEECDGHSGVGWYYWSTDYPDEGSVGAFTSRRAAYDHACDSGWIS